MNRIARRVKTVILALSLDRRGIDLMNPATVIGLAAATVGGAMGATSLLNQTASNANSVQTSQNSVNNKLTSSVGGSTTAAPASVSPVQQ